MLPECWNSMEPRISGLARYKTLASLASQPYFSLFPVGGAGGRVWTLWAVPRRNVIIIAAGHAHGTQIKTFIQLCVLWSLCPQLSSFRTIPLAHVEQRVVSKVDVVCSSTYCKSGHRRGFRQIENSRASRLDVVLALARSLSSTCGV